MSGFWRTFWLYSQWSVEFLVVPPFVVVTAIVAAILGIGLFLNRAAVRQHAARLLLWSTVLASFFPALLAIAVTWAVPPGPSMGPKNEPALFASEILSYAALGLGIVFIYFSKGHRWLAASIVLSQQWVLQGAYLISASALTGVWP